MSELTIQEHLCELKLAQNVFQATHMANGLHLYDLKTVEEQVERAKLYRLWRNSGEPSKVAFAKAIEGKKPYELIENVEPKPRLTSEEREKIMHNLGFDKE